MTSESPAVPKSRLRLLCSESSVPGNARKRSPVLLGPIGPSNNNVSLSLSLSAEKSSLRTTRTSQHTVVVYLGGYSQSALLKRAVPCSQPPHSSSWLSPRPSSRTRPPSPSATKARVWHGRGNPPPPLSSRPLSSNSLRLSFASKRRSATVQITSPSGDRFCEGCLTSSSRDLSHSV